MTYLEKDHRQDILAWHWLTATRRFAPPFQVEGWMIKRYSYAFVILLLAMTLTACSTYPPDELFTDNIRRMVALDRGLGFKEEITSITVVKRIEHPGQYEIQVRVEGWATHPDLTIGATLPASTEKRGSWAMWTFFCKEKEDESWFVEEKFKVGEGFE